MLGPSLPCAGDHRPHDRPDRPCGTGPLTESNSIGGTDCSRPEGYEGRRARTWVRTTRPGRTAFLAEIAHLKEPIRRVDAATDLL